MDGINCNFCFFPPGDAVSEAVLGSFIEVAEKLADEQESKADVGERSESAAPSITNLLLFLHLTEYLCLTV